MGKKYSYQVVPFNGGNFQSWNEFNSELQTTLSEHAAQGYRLKEIVYGHGDWRPVQTLIFEKEISDDSQDHGIYNWREE